MQLIGAVDWSVSQSELSQSGATGTPGSSATLLSRLWDHVVWVLVRTLLSPLSVPLHYCTTAILYHFSITAYTPYTPYSPYNPYNPMHSFFLPIFCFFFFYYYSGYLPFLCLRFYRVLTSTAGWDQDRPCSLFIFQTWFLTALVIFKSQNSVI